MSQISLHEALLQVACRVRTCNESKKQAHLAARMVPRRAAVGKFVDGYYFCRSSATLWRRAWDSGGQGQWLGRGSRPREQGQARTCQHLCLSATVCNHKDFQRVIAVLSLPSKFCPNSIFWSIYHRTIEGKRFQEMQFWLKQTDTV